MISLYDRRIRVIDATLFLLKPRSNFLLLPLFDAPTRKPSAESINICVHIQTALQRSQTEMHKPEEQTAGDKLLNEFKPSASEERLLQFEIIFCKDSTRNRFGLSNSNKRSSPH